MIHGLGVDAVEIDRIRAACERWGDRFLARVFTPEERADCADRADPAPSLAARFAAKEAAYKAVGTWTGPISWRDLAVTHAPAGQPRLVLSSRARARCPLPGELRFHCALSHTARLALAAVVVETAPGATTG